MPPRDATCAWWPPAWPGTVGGGICGAAFLTWMAGPGLLDPTGIEWLMKLDWVPHYFGWHYFRNEPWHWPPGTITGYYAPLGTSIGLTDSIPLAAYLLKPWSAWLPAHFQYISLWWLLCFTLQGALGARLTARATAQIPLQVLGAVLFVLVPTLLARVGHAALCSHWLLLWALLIASRPCGTATSAAEWAALGLCGGLIQPYLAAMSLAVLAAVAVEPRDRPLRGRAAAFGAATLATVLGWWLSGLFVLEGEGALAAGGLGYYSLNLLAPITPGGWSRVLPAVPVAGDGQTYEGFQYLGLGLLALMAVATALAVRARRHGGPPLALFGPAVVTVALLMTAFAVSPVVTLGRSVVVDLNGPIFAPLAAFRSSGRFFWPLAYILVSWAVVTVVRRLSPPAATAVLAAAIALQFADLGDAYASRRVTARDPGFQQWTQPFRAPGWDTVGAYRHFVLVPPPQCGAAPVPYEAAVRLAADHGMTVNAGVIARGDVGARRRYCTTLEADVRAGRLEPGHIYLVDAATARALTGLLAERVSCITRDDLWTCVATSGAQVERGGP